MPVERALGPLRRGAVFGRRQHGFDDMRRQHRHGRQGSETGRRGLVTTGAIDSMHELFPAQLLEIVGGAAGGVGGSRRAANALHLLREVRRGKPAGEDRQGEHRLGDPTHACSIEVNAADLCVAHLRRERQRLECLTPDETAIDARQGIDKAFEDGLQFDDELRKLRERAAAQARCCGRSPRCEGPVRLWCRSSGSSGRSAA